MHLPYVAGYASVPLAMLTEAQIAKLQRMATAHPKAYEKEGTPAPVHGWKQTQNFLHLPVRRGMEMVNEVLGYELKFVNKTSLGHAITVPTLPDPNHPDASPGQPVFCNKLLHATLNNYAVGGEAGTGNGKTAASLYVAGKLLRTTLVIAPTENIAVNWREEIVKHWRVDESDIGWAQTKKICDYEGKKIVVTVLKSIANIDYSIEFYRYFGTLICDEVHLMAANTFSKALGKIPARYKIALSATPERKDGCAKIFLNYFGATFVKAPDDPPMDCDAILQTYNLPFEPGTFPNQRGTAITILTKLQSRNDLLMRWVATLYKKKRVILVLSERIDHLCYLRDRAVNELGIPAYQVCIYARQEVVNGKRVTITQNELSIRKKDVRLRVYFASYGIFNLGENIPPLDAGIEATPTANGKQPPGRVRRRRKNKLRPVWLSILDKGSWLLERMSKTRVKEFQSVNIKILNQP